MLLNGARPTAMWIRLLAGVVAAVVPAVADYAPLLHEAISREVSLLMVSDPTQVCREAVSREVTVFASSDPTLVLKEAVSREVSIVMQTFAAPTAVTGLSVSVTSTGGRASLDWSGYNEVAQHDVAFYAVYVSDHAFTNVTALTAYTNVTAGTFAAVLDGLPPWHDRYFAVVAVDTLGGFVSNVACISAYVLARETLSREVSILGVSDPTPRYPEAISREVSMVNASLAAPAAIAGLTVSTTPTGDRATLDWSAYNEVAQHDVAHYDIYWSPLGVTNVSLLVPCTNVLAGTYSITLDSLTPWQDRFFAVVPVDVLGGFDPGVQPVSSYVIAREAVSREVSVLGVSDPTLLLREAVSREVSILVPDASIPEPVCYAGSPFAVQTSVSGYQAIDLDWSFYNEVAQHDVGRYRIYLAPAYFESVAGLTPFAYAPAGTRTFTLGGLAENSVYAVAVVAEDVLGQWNPAARSVFAASSAARTCGLDLRAWLQGAFDPAGGRMRTDLHADLPLDSPYALAPLRVSSIATNVTDWVLAELVDSNGLPVRAQSAWLRSDGVVVSPGHTQMVWKVSDAAAFRLALQHRNHLGVVSAVPLAFTNDHVAYDFTLDADRATGGTNSLLELVPGLWALPGGDADGDGRITPVDREIVERSRGMRGYLNADLNLDGVVDGED